jgi:hypothetical protein
VDEPLIIDQSACGSFKIFLDVWIFVEMATPWCLSGSLSSAFGTLGRCGCREVAPQQQLDGQGTQKTGARVPWLLTTAIHP